LIICTGMALLKEIVPGSDTKAAVMRRGPEFSLQPPFDWEVRDRLIKNRGTL
jgi:hypothetical protein